MSTKQGKLLLIGFEFRSGFSTMDGYGKCVKFEIIRQAKDQVYLMKDTQHGFQFAEKDISMIYMREKCNT